MEWGNQEQSDDYLFRSHSQWVLNCPENGLISHSVTAGGFSSVEMTQGISNSLDSLDCLLSPSTDTASVEDDGASMIFSGGKAVWDFAAVSTPAKKRMTTHRNLDFNDEIQNKNRQKQRKPSSETHPNSSSTISFQNSPAEPDAEAIAQMKEMIYRAAAFRPVNFAVETVEKPKRKNVKISKDPQTVAARQRREKISEKIRVLQKLVPGGTKMDTASMLDEAANYLKFLRSQVKALEALGPKMDTQNLIANLQGFGFSFPFFCSSISMHQPQASMSNHKSKSELM